MSGLLASLVRALARAFCGPTQAPEQQQQQQQGQWQQQQQQPQWQQQQQGHEPVSYPPRPPQQPEHHQQHQQGQQRPHGKPYQNDYLAHAQDPEYTRLRARADAAGDAMRTAFDGAHAAFEAHDGARAKALSEEGKAHKAELARLNAEAAEWIYSRNNRDRGPGEVDLHGLRVKEAIERTDAAIQDAQRRGDTELRLIVGKGLHSEDHKAKIKPAIEDLMRKYQLVAELDPQNAGVLVVYLGGRGGSGTAGRGIDPDEITRRLDNDKSCIIM